MIRLSLKYRKITLLFFFLAVAAGFLSFISLERRENPEIALNVAMVRTVYPGASPEKVEQLVTKPIEEKINEMDNISRLESSSYANVSVITVELQPGSDYERSWEILRQKVQEAESDLPAEAHKPEVNDHLDKIAQQILHLVVEHPEDLESLRPVAEDWQKQLGTISGVSSVELVGLPDPEVRVTLDVEKLARYRLPWTVAAQALQSAHDRVPLGTLDQGTQEFYLHLTGEWRNVEEIAETVIYRTPEGMPVKLKDVAEVALTTDKKEEYILYNGKPAIAIVIHAEDGVDVPSLQDRIDEKIGMLQSRLPEQVTLASVFSQKESVEHLFSELGRELLLGMIAVIIVCSLGLTFGTALMVALAIPISVAIGFIPLGTFGIDLNQITIASLVIVLGILVDDAIVVNDNIERRLHLGDSPYQAALKGSREVAVSILTATAATAAAFFPLFFLEGNIGEFIRPIPVVITLTLAASMVMSLTVIPIFRQWAGERRSPKGALGPESRKPPGILGKGFERLSQYYGKQIHRFLRRPLLTGLVALAVGTGSFGLLPFMGVQYFPKAEKEEFLIDVILPEGSSVEATEQVIREADEWIRNQPGVKSVAAYAGRTSPKFYYAEMESTGPNIGQLMVRIDRTRVEAGELLQPWREQLQKMFPGVEVLPRELEQGPPVGAPISIAIKGSDLTTLREISQDFQEMLSRIPGTVNISDDLGLDMYAVDLQFDREKASLYGVTDRDLSMSVRLATEGLEVASLQQEDKLLDVVLYSGTENEDPLTSVKRLMVPSQAGMPVPLAELVTFKPAWMTKVIHHDGLIRSVTVRSYAEGRLASEIMRDFSEQLKQYPLPDGYEVNIAGEDEERNQAFADIGRLSVAVLFLIYIIIAMQFYSLSIPVLILTTVYLATGGALIGLFATGSPVGFMALMGIVSLSGIVVRNGIVLIEFIDQQREQGLPLHDAVVEAGKARLRPILLTMATAVFGLLPMAVLGGSLWRPMATAIMSGLIFSTLLTLIVVPSLYVLLAKWRERRHPVPVEEPAGAEM